MIFCKNCKYKDFWGCSYGSVDYCMHPDLIEHYHEALTEWTQNPHCEDINKNNDYKLFEQKKTPRERLLKWLGLFKDDVKECDHCPLIHIPNEDVHKTGVNMPEGD